MTQEEALKILKTGANVFLTGEPGSGKTHTINSYVAYLRERGIEPAITASTGIAATHINGMTIHSWSGIGINKNLSMEDLDAIASRKRIISRMDRVNILIIDEISMLDAQTLDSVEAVCGRLKKDRTSIDLPWGGLQVVFVGDFFQLPPISRTGEPPAKFSFHSKAWGKANPTVCYLHEQYRQEDEKFLAMLASVRENKINENVHKILSSVSGKPENSEKNHTRLYAHNINVDRVNCNELYLLPGDEKSFEMESRGPEDMVGQLKRGCLSPETLKLKIGARVMFTKNNFDEGFANGTLGKVTGFTEEEGLPLVKISTGRIIEVPIMEWAILDGSRTLARIFQIPLRLAWAITIHKSQGITLDSATIDLSEAFEYGQGYVALSRVKTLGGLNLIGYNQKSLEVHPEVLKIDADFKRQSFAALKNFSKTSPADLAEMEKKFIIRCNGKINGEKPAKKKNARLKSNGADKESTYDKTWALWKQGNSPEEIADIRELSRGTIFSHLEELFMQKKISGREFRKLAPEKLLESLPEIKSAFKESGSAKLTPIFEKFGGKFSYEDLRIARIISSAE